MNSSKASSLEDLLKSLEREREALKHLLLSGKISHGTFDALEKRVDRMISVVSELEEAFKEEESFWRKNLLNGIKIFENILVELEHKRLLGEIGEEEYQHNSEVISDGLKSIRNQMKQNERPKEIIITPPQQSKENSAYRKTENEMGKSNPRRSEDSMRKNRKSGETAFNDESQGVSEVHCMNPWNPECRNTDIEVSIYYEGRMVPICRQCWEEIANKDVEWSGLERTSSHKVG